MLFGILVLVIVVVIFVRKSGFAGVTQQMNERAALYQTQAQEIIKREAIADVDFIAIAEIEYNLANGGENQEYDGVLTLKNGRLTFLPFSNNDEKVELSSLNLIVQPRGRNDVLVTADDGTPQKQRYEIDDIVTIQGQAEASPEKLVSQLTAAGATSK